MIQRNLQNRLYYHSDLHNSHQLHYPSLLLQLLVLQWVHRQIQREHMQNSRLYRYPLSKIQYHQYVQAANGIPLYVNVVDVVSILPSQLTFPATRGYEVGNALAVGDTPAAAWIPVKETYLPLGLRDKPPWCQSLAEIVRLPVEPDNNKEMVCTILVVAEEDPGDHSSK